MWYENWYYAAAFFSLAFVVFVVVVSKNWGKG